MCVCVGLHTPPTHACPFISGQRMVAPLLFWVSWCYFLYLFVLRWTCSVNTGNASLMCFNSRSRLDGWLTNTHERGFSIWVWSWREGELLFIWKTADAPPNRRNLFYYDFMLFYMHFMAYCCCCVVHIKAESGSHLKSAGRFWSRLRQTGGTMRGNGFPCTRIRTPGLAASWSIHPRAQMLFKLKMMMAQHTHHRFLGANSGFLERRWCLTDDAEGGDYLWTGKEQANGTARGKRKTRTQRKQALAINDNLWFIN